MEFIIKFNSIKKNGTYAHSKTSLRNHIRLPAQLKCTLENDRTKFKIP